jgi:hypothetical protein
MGLQVEGYGERTIEGYELHLTDGYVLVPEGQSLTSTDVNKLTLSLLALGYKLCDPFDIEPEHIRGGVRFFVVPDNEAFSWQ